MVHRGAARRRTPEVVEALAAEWAGGSVPGTWYAASPGRAELQSNLIGDWLPDDPITIAVIGLMLDWLRWLGERANLPEHLRERTISAFSAR